jgi:hypothetical protein
MTEETMLAAIGVELAKARAKFPVQSVWVTLAALTEEVGELNASILQFNHEPGKGVTIDAIHREAVQVAVMALRVMLDCNVEVHS